MNPKGLEPPQQKSIHMLNFFVEIMGFVLKKIPSEGGGMRM